MKTNKALKRLAKIEASISNMTERYSSAPHIRETLQDAKAAVTRAKEAVSLQRSAGKAKNPPVEHSEPPSKAKPEPSEPKRQLRAAGRKAIIAATKKRWRLQKAAAKAAAKQSTPAKRKAAVKKAAVKKAAKKAPAAPAVTQAAGQPAPRLTVGQH